MRKMCDDCLHFDHCVNIPNYPVTENTIACCDWERKDDYVPVVRCKDCVHYYEREPVCLKIYSDGNVSSDAWQERKPDDFCSYGERKDGVER